MSVSQGNIGVYPGFWPNAASPEDRQRLGIAKGKMAIRPWPGRKPSGPAWRAGLRGSHVITAVDGQSPDRHGRGFLVWLHRTHRPGDTLRLTVLDANGETRAIEFALPAR